MPFQKLLPLTIVSFHTQMELQQNSTRTYKISEIELLCSFFWNIIRHARHSSFRNQLPPLSVKRDRLENQNWKTWTASSFRTHANEIWSKEAKYEHRVLWVEGLDIVSSSCQYRSRSELNIFTRDIQNNWQNRPTHLLGMYYRSIKFSVQTS